MDERNRPYVIQCEPGRQAICTCGASAEMPRCDGSHKGTDKRPTLIELEEAKSIAICACGRTGTPPYCDGAHSKAPSP